MRAIARSVVLLSAMAVITSGCGGGGGDSFPANSVRINGTTSHITSVTIWYRDGDRTVGIETDDGSNISLYFKGMGDPSVPANELPLGSWTVMDASTFIDVYVGTTAANTHYGAGSDYTGSVTVGGVPGTSVTLDAAYEFTSAHADVIGVKYSGPYAFSFDT
jgi:hypothetical protein